MRARLFAVFIVALPCGLLGTVSALARLPAADRRRTDSRVAKAWLEKAEQILAQPERSIAGSRFTQARHQLADAKFLMDVSIECAIPSTHPAAAYLAKRIADLNKQIREWGDGESPERQAKAWWDRIFAQHLKETVLPVWQAMKKNEDLSPEQVYFLPRYFSRVIMPDLAKFKARYPDPAALAQLVNSAGGNLGDGWAFCPPDLRDRPKVAGTIALVEHTNNRLPDFAQANIGAAVDYGRGTPVHALRALDTARVVLSLRPGHPMAEKIRAKAQQWTNQYL